MDRTATAHVGRSTGEGAAGAMAAVEAMGAALVAGDLDAVMACYEQELAVAFSAEEAATTDAAQVREAFAFVASVQPELAFGEHEVVAVGDLALHLAPWSMRGTAPDGTAVEQRGLSVSVLRRQPDGGWRLVIDQPYGDRLVLSEAAGRVGA